ncbi:hypothetical protein Tco_1115034, partial [Tanacetum coccineum]
MTTLADKSLLSRGDNKPPMLEKHLYDSRKSRMELYMLKDFMERNDSFPLVEKGHTFGFHSPWMEQQLRNILNLTPTEAIHVIVDIKAYKPPSSKVQAIKQVVKFKEEEITFLAHPGLLDTQTSQTVITHNVAYQAVNLDAYDSDCDKLNSPKIALMANLSRNGSDALTESETEITSDSNIIPYSQYLGETQQGTVQNSNSSAQQDVLILSIYKEEVTDLKEMQLVENSFPGSNEQYAEIERLEQNIFEQVQENDSL